MPLNPFRRRMVGAACAAALTLAASPLLAQSWPGKPVRLIVPAAAGAAPDVVARLLADKLGAALGQGVVVDNRPGAGGIPGMSALARAGYDVAINYATSARGAQAVAAEAAELGARTLLLQCDVADDAAVRQMLAAVGEQFGHLDALVNNAGTTASWKIKDLESLDMAEWDRTFAVNVRGTFQVTRAAVPWLRKGTNASVVNSASIVGLRPGPQPLPYAASKAAVVNLTKTLAWNLGPDIRVNAVAPGWMEGEWMQRMLGDKYADLMGKRAKLTPLKRCVTADDVAETVLNLLQGNRFVTGEVIVIDGGFTSST